MLLTLVPLILAGAVTLEICALAGIALNFANVIALPLLLGVGVAFKIYYIMAWRAGKTGLLQSTLTRAVVFSAMTNAVAFGSMWSSSYPGMSSMGKLMALALLCTMAAAVLFQPVLMGRPRQIRNRSLPDSAARVPRNEAMLPRAKRIPLPGGRQDLTEPLCDWSLRDGTVRTKQYLCQRAKSGSRNHLNNTGNDRTVPTVGSKRPPLWLPKAHTLLGRKQLVPPGAGTPKTQFTTFGARQLVTVGWVWEFRPQRIPIRHRIKRHQTIERPPWHQSFMSIAPPSFP